MIIITIRLSGDWYKWWNHIAVDRKVSGRKTRNATHDKGNRGASTTVVLNTSGTSSRLRRGFSSTSHGYFHGASQGVPSRVRKWQQNIVGSKKVGRLMFWITWGLVRGHARLSSIVYQPIENIFENFLRVLGFLIFSWEAKRKNIYIKTLYWYRVVKIRWKFSEVIMYSSKVVKRV